MIITALIDDPGYPGGRVLDVTDWTIGAMMRLQEVWDNNVELEFC